MVVARENIGPGPIKLNIKASRHMYSFSYAIGDREPQNLAEGETRYLSSEIAGGYTGVYFALYATGHGKRCMTPAYFDWFDYSPSE